MITHSVSIRSASFTSHETDYLDTGRMLTRMSFFSPGPERKSVEIDKKNKTITAYHESGHAIVAYFTKDAMPINKATIMPRGPTLGHVSFLFNIISLYHLCYFLLKLNWS